ncbi:MAG: glycoside hydrolase, partial [Candidatus Ornithomonoglobus sp.]
MRAKKLLSAITALTMLPTVGALSLPVTASAASSGTVVRLDPSEASPWEFEGWGTSMGWWGNRIGYSDTLAQQAAELFYSEDGLGLDIVRYNVGGGDDPTHNHITRSDSKLPCFAVPEYNEDGTLKTGENGDVVYSYNWDNDHNQINVLKEIKEQNPNVHIEGYTNSPPWFMTISGCSSGGVDATENLDPENYDNFAVFLADVTEHMDTIGLTFDSYSPMNEPNPATKYWGAYSPKQEGNLVAQGEHQSGIITALKSEYTKRGITTLVAGMDETSIDYSISSYNQLTDDAKTALDRIDTHTYGGSNRAGLKATAVAADKPLWMSEVDGGWNGFGLADRIILDMNGMQPGAWVMWDIVDFHKDSAFQAPDGSYTEASAALNPTATLWGVAMANHDTQEIELANKYYAYGQFTRYINPGDTIIASSGSTLAAYNKTTGDIKIVVSNSSSADKPYTFDLSAFTNTGSTVKEIRSNNSTGDAAEHWAEITGEAALTDKKITTTAKAGTVTTYIVSGNGPTNYAIIKGGSSQIGIGSTVTLTVNTNLTGDIKWSVSDDTKADITDNGVLTAKDSGEVTVYAAVGDFTVSRDFTIPLYTLTGTPSWCSASTRPDDNADYLKAADGDLSTYFDGNQNGWIKYDYGTPFKISEIKLAARSGSGMPE